jgi:hypothetical protein
MTVRRWCEVFIFIPQKGEEGALGEHIRRRIRSSVKG